MSKILVKSQYFLLAQKIGLRYKNSTHSTLAGGACMGYFLRQDKKKKGIYLQMYETYWDSRLKQARTRCIKSFGYVSEFITEDIPDPVVHFKQQVREEETKPRAFDEPVEKNVGYFLLS